MRKKIILWLSFAIVFSFTLHSCVHDEINSSTDPSSKEYHSKSLWKEDEVYIKNVMQVYFEHENDITKGNGIPLWDYAMTMGYANESFLLVPIADGNKIISCLQVPRNGGNITFMYENDPEHLKFFQGYTTLKDRRPLKLENFTSQTGRPAQVPCKISSVSMWYPDDEYGANGHWETHTVVTCPPEPIDGEGGETNPPQGPTYPYPGGGNSQPQQPKPPCERTKAALQNPKVKEKTDEMKNQSTLPASDPNSGETGYKFNADGTPSQKIIGGKHEVSLGSTAGYQGGYHNHTLAGIKMLAPADIAKMLQFAMAQPNGNIGDGYMGMIGSEVCSSCPGGYNYYHYIIHFTGDASELANYLYNNNWDLEEFKANFQMRYSMTKPENSNLNEQGLERLFFKALNDMGLNNNVSLQRIEDNGTINNITLDSNNNPIPNPCP